ncbi:MAG: DUF4349 domain-containing protein [Candidatus Leucobacter sulfamidivorax]|nr:DUF4349 domain-containing protein [Candidatus Leucobacter sulfamidivorax]
MTRRHPASIARVLSPLLAAGLLLAPLTACASPNISSAGSTVELDKSVSGGDAAAPEVAADGSSMVSPVEAGASVIRSGDIELVVDDTAAAAEQVAALVDGLGGHVESSSISGTSQTSAYLLIRVPSERFDDAFEQLGELGEVSSQYRSATDVTMQHVDLQARVEALEASVDRLTELMRGAATTSELLEAETALSQRQAELDGLRAQLDFLENQIDESSISVTLRTETVLPGGPANFWDGLRVGVDSLGNALTGSIVILGVLLPWLGVLAVIAVIVLLIVWLSTRRRGRKHADPTPPAAAGPHETAPADQAPGTGTWQ